MTPTQIAVISVVGLVAWVVLGIVTTIAYSVSRAKLGRDPHTETELAWLVVGWPFTFFVTLGVGLRRLGNWVQIRSGARGAELPR